MSHSVRRIHKIASFLEATSYLEVGVCTGSTFINIEIDKKDAVDPHFRFAYEPLGSDKVRFFEMKSDEFFSTLPSAEKYDVIFLDGLHLFEQTLRDFTSSLSHAHDRTIWLIDDTRPVDVFSAVRNQARAVSQRRALLGPGAHDGWHGDTFKIVPTLHDFFPKFDYRTITGGGNPQTLVWQAPRRGFQPYFDSLEAISRMDFFSISDHQHLFKLTSEEAAFEDLRRSRATD